VGLELDFMYQTCRVAREHAGEGRGAELAHICHDQLGFLDEHLLTWVPAFAGDVAMSARTGFYRGMAHLLAGFLAIDRTILTELLCPAPLSVQDAGPASAALRSRELVTHSLESRKY
jgi:hypothetical protein